MQKFINLVFAIAGIAITTWLTGRPPKTTGEFIAYTLPGAVLGYLLGPILAAGLTKVFGGRPADAAPAALPGLSEAERSKVASTYAHLPIPKLEELLEKPADLAPGAEDLLKEELRRRREADAAR